MNVSLTPELERFISSEIETGRYNSPSDVIGEALRLLEEHEKGRAARRAEFNREIGLRLASLDRGEWIDPAESRAKMERKSQRRRSGNG